MSFCSDCFHLIGAIAQDLHTLDVPPAHVQPEEAAQIRVKLNAILSKLQAIDECLLAFNGKHEIAPSTQSRPRSEKLLDMHGLAHLRSRTKNAAAATVSAGCRFCEVSNFYESDKGGGDWILCRPPCPNKKQGPHFRLRLEGE